MERSAFQIVERHETRRAGSAPRTVLDTLSPASRRRGRPGPAVVHARPAGDNPTIGLILCFRKNEAIAKYSVLSENRQIFAAKYVKILPTEAELRHELQRERRLLETRGAKLA